MYQFHEIEDAIKDFRQGRILIVVDNEDRENEGDFICAAETITPEIVNFMASQGRGLLCAPLEENRADELNLPLMVRNNTSLHETAFTVSIDLIGNGCSTGISASDRSLTIQALADKRFTAQDFARPGHIFPLRAKSGGVLQRAGHTEAVIDMAKLSGLQPAGALIEILNEDGSMARLPQLMEKARQFDLKIISIHDLVEYRLRSEKLVRRESSLQITILQSKYTIIQYKQVNTGDVHIAFVKGEPSPETPSIVRVQHADSFAELIDVIINEKSAYLMKAFQIIDHQPNGVLLLLSSFNQASDPLSRIEKRPSHVMSRPEQEQREIGIGSQILRDLGVGKMSIISNAPKKTIGLQAYGLEILSYIPLD